MTFMARGQYLIRREGYVPPPGAPLPELLDLPKEFGQTFLGFRSLNLAHVRDSYLLLLTILFNPA